MRMPSRQWEPPHPCLSVLAVDPEGILGIERGDVPDSMHPLVPTAGHTMAQTAVLRVTVPPAPSPPTSFLVFGEI